jgi:hypothetical protein
MCKDLFDNNTLGRLLQGGNLTMMEGSKAKPDSSQRNAFGQWSTHCALFTIGSASSPTSSEAPVDNFQHFDNSTTNVTPISGTGCSLWISSASRPTGFGSNPILGNRSLRVHGWNPTSANFQRNIQVYKHNLG